VYGHRASLIALQYLTISSHIRFKGWSVSGDGEQKGDDERDRVDEYGEVRTIAAVEFIALLSVD